MTGRNLGLKFPTNFGSGIFVSSIRTTIIILPLVTSYYVLFVSYELCVKKENQIIFWNILWHFFQLWPNTHSCTKSRYTRNYEINALFGLPNEYFADVSKIEKRIKDLSVHSKRNFMIWVFYTLATFHCLLRCAIFRSRSPFPKFRSLFAFQFLAERLQER